MTHRIGAEGQVVIPKEPRERAGLHPGAEVDFEIDGERTEPASRGDRLGSWAALARLDGEEPALRRLNDLVGSGVMSWVNAVEVSDRTERDHGRAEADEVMRELRAPLSSTSPAPRSWSRRPGSRASGRSAWPIASPWRRGEARPSPS